VRTELEVSEPIAATLKQRKKAANWKRRVDAAKYLSSGKIAVIFAVPGVLSLVFSVLANSQVLAFIGLGLTFWGALFLMVRPTSYVKVTLLDATALSVYRTIDRMAKDLRLSGKAFYIPSYPKEVYIPEHLKGLKDMLAFLSSSENVASPPIVEIAAGKFFVSKPSGIFIAPPGLGLLDMFEKELRTDPTRLNLEYLCESLPQLILENFQLAREIEMKAEQDHVTLRIVDSTFKNLYLQEGLKSPLTLGCPLVSAIACAVAKTSGRIVSVDSINVSEDAETIGVRCGLMEG
jgi:hypothetical protein